MSINNAVTNVIPDDIKCQDSLDNQLEAFIIALKEILDMKSGMFYIDKDNVVAKQRDDDVEKIKGVKFTVISTA